ncbi:uncharacterized protein LOC132637760 [Lycium barbarum]|uniref:uncharacterized protein LOC132637760 n=1 Tax=Lycium barbarum TaxID=112863 RepID=UPI00293E698F|nr:uncharacterized protein LOC132637760 [Lycium barbarum]
MSDHRVLFRVTLKKNSKECKAITLMNGRVLEEVPPKNKKKLDAELIPAQRTEPEKSPEIVMQQSERVVTIPPPPFPQRFQKQNIDAACKNILDILKQVHINIPLVELLQEVLKYAKYIKNIVTNKRHWTEFVTKALNEGCSSRVRSKIPPKQKDPGSFTISITIGNIKLADTSLAYPDGIIEDALVKVGHFIQPIHFIILDYEADKNVPLIMGRRFLAAVDTELKMTTVVEPEHMIVELDYFQASRDPLEIALLYGEDLVDDETVEECLTLLTLLMHRYDPTHCLRS